jgi:dTMP kinase
MKGRFITFEGIEGVGKSTQAGLAAGYLRDKGYDVVATREPGGTRVGELIREVLLGSHDATIAGETELLLMFAARHENIVQNIRPALAQGQWVLCDRFTDASFAYQGGGRGLAPERIATLERLVQGDLQPDLTLLFDAPVAAGFERLRERGRPDRFEREQIHFFDAVRMAYLKRAQEYPERFRVVDATRSIATVQSMVQRALNSLT